MGLRGQHGHAGTRLPVGLELEEMTALYSSTVTPVATVLTGSELSRMAGFSWRQRHRSCRRASAARRTIRAGEMALPLANKCVKRAGSQRSARHPGRTAPALLEAAFHQFTASAEPAMLRHMLQVMQQFSRPGLLGRMMNPDLRQTLIRRQLARHASQILALHTGGDAFHRQRVSPQRGNRQIGGLSQAQHGEQAYAALRFWGDSGQCVLGECQHCSVSW